MILSILILFILLHIEIDID